ncbi:cytochrome b [Derxia gummosa]|uniref:Cytochrome b n=1 Tax=Derxia gummosa DSM 723 TaxID=1121388 RepID=A0A8B6XAS3_9BURK|nr:cytochrome b/b6 domain-containing protein [Derxia gummosa]
MLNHTPAIHPPLLRALHWATLACVLAALGIALARESFESHALRMTLLQWHRLAGLLAFALTLARIVSRFGLATAEPLRDAPAAQRLLAAGAHLGLYALLVLVPLLGWLASNAHGNATLPFGIHLPVLVEADDDLADQLEEAHGVAAWSFLALAGLHAAAALWHHHFKRDDVLVAMLPRLRR